MILYGGQHNLAVAVAVAVAEDTGGMPTFLQPTLTYSRRGPRGEGGGIIA